MDNSTVSIAAHAQPTATPVHHSHLSEILGILVTLFILFICCGSWFYYGKNIKLDPNQRTSRLDLEMSNSPLQRSNALRVSVNSHGMPVRSSRSSYTGALGHNQVPRRYSGRASSGRVSRNF